MSTRRGNFCADHMPYDGRSKHWLTGARDCDVRHDDCICPNLPEGWITKGCPQHLPYSDKSAR